jgi:UDP-N-acetylmuramoyl-tripeptide--D-alanyl-D-alanine ligase
MKPTTLERIAAAVGGTVRDADGSVVATSIVVDSRSALAGSLFVALSGERVDGHAYVAAALENGASGVLVRRGWRGSGPRIEVDDPAAALIGLARREREGLRATVIGITGSTGKTLTKDLTAATLAERFSVVASPASFNNEIGLPLTLLSATEATEAVVCEMGSRGPGHIRLLCEVARPRVGVVTNVGVAHMELFGSPQVLRDAKAELPEALPADGTAVLNADDAVVRSYAKRTHARAVVFYGTSPDADVRAADVSVSRETGAATFDLITPAGSSGVRLPIPGEHIVPDALAAAAVAWSLGVDVDRIAYGLAHAAVSEGRMHVVQADGVRLIDDSYNANPTSMGAALKALRWMAGTSRCVAVLGYMAELGHIADVEHERIGELAARLGIDELVVVGREARLIAVGAEREGVERERIHRCEDVPRAIEVLGNLLRPGDLVLVKASRVARLERVVHALRSGLPGTPDRGDAAVAGTKGETA